MEKGLQPPTGDQVVEIRTESEWFLVWAKQVGGTGRTSSVQLQQCVSFLQKLTIADLMKFLQSNEFRTLSMKYRDLILQFGQFLVKHFPPSTETKEAFQEAVRNHLQLVDISSNRNLYECIMIASIYCYAMNELQEVVCDYLGRALARGDKDSQKWLLSWLFEVKNAVTLPISMKAQIKSYIEEIIHKQGFTQELSQLLVLWPDCVPDQYLCCLIEAFSQESNQVFGILSNVPINVADEAEAGSKLLQQSQNSKRLAEYKHKKYPNEELLRVLVKILNEKLSSQEYAAALGKDLMHEIYSRNVLERMFGVCFGQANILTIQETLYLFVALQSRMDSTLISTFFEHVACSLVTKKSISEMKRSILSLGCSANLKLNCYNGSNYLDYAKFLVEELCLESSEELRKMAIEQAPKFASLSLRLEALIKLTLQIEEKENKMFPSLMDSILNHVKVNNCCTYNAWEVFLHQLSEQDGNRVGEVIRILAAKHNLQIPLYFQTVFMERFGDLSNKLQILQSSGSWMCVLLKSNVIVWEEVEKCFADSIIDLPPTLIAKYKGPTTTAEISDWIIRAASCQSELTNLIQVLKQDYPFLLKQFSRNLFANVFNAVEHETNVDIVMSNMFLTDKKNPVDAVSSLNLLNDNIRSVLTKEFAFLLIDYIELCQDKHYQIVEWLKAHIDVLPNKLQRQLIRLTTAKVFSEFHENVANQVLGTSEVSKQRMKFMRDIPNLHDDALKLLMSFIHDKDELKHVIHCLAASEVADNTLIALIDTYKDASNGYVFCKDIFQCIATNLVDEHLKENIPQEEHQHYINAIWYGPFMDNVARVLMGNWGFNSGISTRHIEKILPKLRDPSKMQLFGECIYIIHSFGLTSSDLEEFGSNYLETMMETVSEDQWVIKINQMAMRKYFPLSSDDTSLERLVSIFADSNRSNIVMTEEDESRLVADIQFVRQIYDNAMSVTGKQIKCMNAEETKEWAALALENAGAIETISDHEKLAVISRAMCLANEANSQTSFSPRDIQLLAVWQLLRSSKEKGRLLQVNTGEGKTNIVAMTAAILALEHPEHQVDIITTSTELAIPQSQHQQLFYSLLKLTVGHNSQTDEGEKSAYSCNIVYGAIGDFQGDVLRDEFSCLGTMKGRKQNIGIVDEVDSMTIDGKQNMVMLASPLPEMWHLQPIYAAIWTQAEVTLECLERKGGQLYYREALPGDNHSTDEEVKYSETLIEGKEIDEVLTASIDSHLRKLLRKDIALPEGMEDPAEYPFIRIPKHLVEFAKHQLPKWIKNMIHAKFTYENKRHYILHEGKNIAPVDAANTGIVQSNMNWGDGLHQGLQLKHGARLTAETVVTNYISNGALFGRYPPQNIYGLTGTIGSPEARQWLAENYLVDCLDIPPFRAKRYKLLAPILSSGIQKWYSSIVESSLSMLSAGRCVLIITSFIDEVDTLKALFEEKYNYDGAAIKIYKTDADSKVISDTLCAGEVIIATNIAGRGTDIKIDKAVERSGGLHVCVTFLPTNQRVEDQNVGRTSRSGHLGTAQFVLLEKSGKQSMDKLRSHRLAREKEDIESARKQVQAIEAKDAVFEQYCSLLKALFPKYKPDPKKSLKRPYDMQALDERFGIWLAIYQDKFEDKFKANDLWNTFEAEIRKDYHANALINNPTYYVLQGNDFLLQGQGVDRFGKAIECYSKAIALDDYFSAQAYYNRAFALIAAYGNKPDCFKQRLQEATSDLTMARTIINNNLEPLLHFLQKASTGECFSEQIQHRFSLYSAQKNVINEAIGEGEGAYEKEVKGLESKFVTGKYENLWLADYDDLVAYLQGNIACEEVVVEATKKANRLINNAGESPTQVEDRSGVIRLLERSEVERICSKSKGSFMANLDRVTESLKKAKDHAITKDVEQSRLEAYKCQLDTKIEILEKQLEAVEKLEDVKKEDIEAIKGNISKIKSLLPLVVGSLNNIQVFDGNLLSVHDVVDRLKSFRYSWSGITPKAEVSLQKQLESYFENDNTAKISKMQEIEVGIIGKCVNEDHHVKIYQQRIEESLPADEDPELFGEDIHEFMDNGFLGGFAVEEVIPTNWWNFLALCIIALVQIVAGALLAVCTLGAAASIGSGLIGEGVSDMITAVQGCLISGNFDWESWGIQKAISFATSVICAGFAAIKKAFDIGVKAVKATTEAVKGVVTSTWKLVAKKIGIEVAKGIAKECATMLVDYGVSKVLMPNIEAEVLNLVQSPLVKALQESSSLKKMLNADALSRNQYFENLIRQKALQLLFPESPREDSAAAALTSIMKGVAVSEIKGVGTALKVYEATAALQQMKTILPKFIQELECMLLSVEFDHKELIDSAIKKQSHIHPTKHSQQQAQLQVRAPSDSRNLEAKFSDAITTKISQLITHKIIKPATDAGINKGLNVAFAKAERQLIADIDATHEHKKQLIVIKTKDDSELDRSFPGNENHSELPQQPEKTVNDIHGVSVEDEPRDQAFSDNDDQPVLPKQSENTVKDTHGSSVFPPVGVDEIEAYAKINNKNFQIKDQDGNIRHSLGDGKSDPIILVQMAEVNAEGITHYEPEGGLKKKQTSTYSCVADSIAQQTGEDPHHVARQLAAVAIDPEIGVDWNNANPIDEYERKMKENNQGRGVGGVLMLTDPSDESAKHMYEERLKSLHSGVEYCQNNEQFKINPTVTVPESMKMSAKLVESIIEHEDVTYLNRRLPEDSKSSAGFDPSNTSGETGTIHMKDKLEGHRLVAAPDLDEPGMYSVYKADNNDDADIVLGHEMGHAHRSNYGLPDAMEANTVANEIPHPIGHIDNDPSLYVPYNNFVADVKNAKVVKEELRNTGIEANEIEPEGPPTRNPSRNGQPYVSVTENDLRKERNRGIAIVYPNMRNESNKIDFDNIPTLPR